MPAAADDSPAAVPVTARDAAADLPVAPPDIPEDGIEPDAGSTGWTGWSEVRLVLATLGAAGCRVWVAGGWGVDLLLGRRTRPHRDLDLAIDGSGLDAGLVALGRLGYLRETDWLPVRIELHRPGHGRVDLHPVIFDSLGDGVQAGFDGEVFHYPAADLIRGSLEGTGAGCLSEGLQRCFRRGYPLRDVDRHDLLRLDELRGGQPPTRVVPENP